MQTADDYPRICDIVRRVLARNIVCGNALTYQTENGLPIEFMHWAFITTGHPIVKPLLYEFQDVVETKGGDKDRQTGLFEEQKIGDNGEPARIVRLKKEFPPVHYLEIGHEAA